MKKMWMYLLTLLIVASMLRLFTYDQRDIQIHCCCCTCAEENNENAKNELKNENDSDTEPYITNDTTDFNYNLTEPTESPYNQNNQPEQETQDTTPDPYNTDSLTTDYPTETETETKTPTTTKISDITNTTDTIDTTDTTISEELTQHTTPEDANGTPSSDIRGPYTLEEINDIFVSDREAFDLIKNTFVNTDYTADIYAIDSINGKKEIYYKDAETEHYIDISQIENHEIISELFNKNNIFSINSYSWQNQTMQRRETGVIFQMLLSDSYEQWILYSETHEFYDSEEPDDSQSGETIKLDDNWYYMYVKY